MLVAVAVYMQHDYGTVAAAAVLAAIVAISTTVMALYGFDKEIITVAGDADDDTSTVAFHNAVMCLTQNRLLQHLASCMSPMQFTVAVRATVALPDERCPG